METVTEVLSNLPKEPRSGLDRYVVSLKNVFGDNMTAVILYRSSGKFH